MYEDYYSPITDIEAVFSRIGLSGLYPGSFKPDLPHLSGLIHAFQTHIPFEALDSSLLGESIRLDIPGLFDKLILRRRGGFCFELNGFFEQLLRDLGYDGFSVFCRIVRGRDYIPPCTHRGIIVKLDQTRYYCDVGFGGPSPCGPVPIPGPDVLPDDETSSSSCHNTDTFWIKRYDADWWTLIRTDEQQKPENILQFTLQPQPPTAFIPVCYYCSTHPESLFVKTKIISLRTENGSKALTDQRFTIHSGKTHQSMVIVDNREYLKILDSEFGIRLPDL